MLALDLVPRAQISECIDPDQLIRETHRVRLRPTVFTIRIAQLEVRTITE